MSRTVLEPLTLPCELVGLFDTADTVDVVFTIDMTDDGQWDVAYAHAGTRNITSLLPSASWPQLDALLAPHVAAPLAEYLEQFREEREEEERDRRWKQHREWIGEMRYEQMREER